MKLPLNTDLTGKTVVITGAGGVLGGMFAKALAQAGGKVALLDLNQEAAEKAAKEISEEGYIAKGYAANVLQKESLAAAHEQIKKDFGLCDILINGAGGNNPKATTDQEYYVALSSIEDPCTNAPAAMITSLSYPGIAQGSGST